MDFSFTEEQQMLKASVRNFLEKEIAPVVNAHEKKGPLTKAETTAFIKQLLPFGYLTGFLPEKYGEAQLEAKTNGILVEELSRVWASLAGTIFIAEGFLGVLSESGSPEQVERYFRDARTMTIPEGTTQMQKLIVGRDIPGLRAMV
jgi:alkylation response protein AidB-like acyl-CoA dehydrogenase